MDEPRTLMLLQLMDLAKQWPTLGAIHDLAMSELNATNDEAKLELVERAKAKAQKEAEANAVKAKVAAADKERADRLAARPAIPAERNRDVRPNA